MYLESIFGINSQNLAQTSLNRVVAVSHPQSHVTSAEKWEQPHTNLSSCYSYLPMKCASPACFRKRLTSESVVGWRRWFRGPTTRVCSEEGWPEGDDCVGKEEFAMWKAGQMWEMVFEIFGAGVSCSPHYGSVQTSNAWNCITTSTDWWFTTYLALS